MYDIIHITDFLPAGFHEALHPLETKHQEQRKQQHLCKGTSIVVTDIPVRL